METIETKTYYGEYTLEHWIDMLLRQDLVLPEYQRSFQWKPDDIQHFIGSLKQNQFVPPIIIGSYTRNGKRGNYIIDGQQRLTALLLANIGFYPKPEDFKLPPDNIPNENGEEAEEEDRIEWTFQKLISKKTDLKSLIQTCGKEHYNELNCNVTPDFFTTHYLGFAYIVPKAKEDETKQLPYFATVFRNINFQGIALTAQESRQALYYWNTQVTNWFNPPFLNNFLHNQHGNIVKLDFVRYASLLSQYNQTNDYDMVFKGKSQTAEQYYVEYIETVSQDIRGSKFGDFISLFPDGHYQEYLDRLEDIARQLGYTETNFDNIVKLDLYFFGLIYHLVFCKNMLNKLDEEQIIRLKAQLDGKIENYSVKHKDSPSNKEFIRQRMKDSIRIFKAYIAK